MTETSPAQKLSHIDQEGSARMVDIGDKKETKRRALAEGVLVAQKTTIDALLADRLPKKEAVSTARLAGILAAKKTADLIPLCHPLGLDHIDIIITSLSQTRILVRAEARLTGKTGVEMEALTAVSVSLLTLYDMAKAVDKEIRITDIRLVEKDGGKSGFWRTAAKG